MGRGTVKLVATTGGFGEYERVFARAEEVGFASVMLRARGLTVSFRRCNIEALLLALSIGVSAQLCPRAAFADVSTWLGVAAGVSQTPKLDLDRPFVPTLRLGTGMGTDPSRRFIIGGMLRVDTLFGNGTDLALQMRLANHGYVNGDWGLALDVGPVARFWGTDSYGAAAVATLGGPWGLEAGFNANFGAEQIRTYGCFLGIDLARLTVYRRSGSSWWKNTFPAYRTPAEEAH